ESATQLKMRADRLQRASDNCFIVTETSLESIFRHIEDVKPGLLIVDSIQTIASDELESAAGSVSQVRECAVRLLKYAKESGVPVILIGHITKDGTLAGPKVLEHIVDAVLQFEGDSNYMYRILRSIKNRFGSTSELGIYEMCRRGLREVTNPSEMLLSDTDEQLSGVAIGVTLEGARPFLIETQALVSTAAYGTPQRSVTGFDSKRMNMLLAVLEKRAGFKIIQKDVFLNIAGGLKVNDPALDLPVISAILSSSVDVNIPRSVCMAGEVGLSGEIRPVTRLEQRILEAEKLGMKTIIVPRNNLKGVDTQNRSIKIVEVGKVEEAFRHLFGKS
ncbi:MAG: DNA repair protein RadA, partial [Muribaculaceae bacterium]|nr:DNA repair protein RadA [Muribaculaceae bacterium]